MDRGDHRDMVTNGNVISQMESWHRDGALVEKLVKSE